MDFKYKNADFAYEPLKMFECSEEFTRGREPTLRRMPDGSLCSTLCTGKGVTDDRLNGNAIGIIRSEDDGATWSEPKILFNHPKRANWASDIFVGGEKPLLFFHAHNEETIFQELRTFVSSSDDSGRTWNEPASIHGVPHNLVPRQGKVLSDGSWLFPAYWSEQRGGWEAFWPSGGKPMPGMYKWFYTCGALKSFDKGSTFSLHGCVFRDNDDPGNAWEPEVTELENGHLLMFIRSDNGILWKSESLDYGYTWTPMEPTDIPNPDTKVVVYKIAECYVMINNTIPDQTKKKQRTRLEMLLSYDNCRTWAKKKVIADVNAAEQEGNIPAACYPHGFADDSRKTFYLAVDCVKMFFLFKIPYRDIITMPNILRKD